MSSKDLSEVEKSALSTAGQAGGRYLDSIEKTDLAVLTPEQWQTFLEIVLRTYEVEIRDRLKDIAPPQLPAF